LATKNKENKAQRESRGQNFPEAKIQGISGLKLAFIALKPASGKLIWVNPLRSKRAENIS
jgi:hypothetical protein